MADSYRLLRAWVAENLGDMNARVALIAAGLTLGRTEEVGPLLRGLPEEPHVVLLRARFLSQTGDPESAIPMLEGLREGAHYGWPYCHSNRVPNPEFAQTTRCGSTEPPALGMQAHSAPLGITFLDKATKLPAEYRGDALVAFHGSWNREEPTGAKVVRLRVRDGKPAGYEDFIIGWQGADGKRWGRPVDVVVAKDGAVLVSDDAAGLILRVAAR